MTEELVLIEKEGSVGIVHLNRPDKLNALSPAMLSALSDALEELDADEEVRVIIIAGSPRVFAAGADIEAMSNLSPLEMKALGTRENIGCGCAVSINQSSQRSAATHLVAAANWPCNVTSSWLQRQLSSPSRRLNWASSLAREEPNA